MKYILPLFLLAFNVVAQTSTYDLYLGDPKTKLYYAYKCDEAKKLFQRSEFGSPEAAEKAGFVAGECTLTNSNQRAEELWNKVIKDREGDLGDGLAPEPDPFDTYSPVAEGTGNCSGKVVGVTDGDTVTILRNNEQIKVRLAGIDAPEKGQAFGQAAKQHLSDLIFGKEVDCDSTKKDGYGRTIGRIRVGGKDVGLLLIEAGLAWHYKRFASEQSAADRDSYATAETLARNVRFGLWRDNNPVSPAVFRSTFDGSDSSTFSGGTSGSSSGSRPSPGGPVRVRSYVRRDGTVVRAHTRSRPRN